jgi:uncharacterized membrane protein (DUF106 family)
MTFTKYAQFEFRVILFAVLAAIFFPLIPLVKGALVYGLCLIIIGFALMGLHISWIEWKALQNRRNSYHIEPFKKRLEKYHQRRQLLAKRS